MHRQGLTLNQALACTGVIWVRYSFVITPVNYNLALVNTFVGATGIYQIWRKVNHTYFQQKQVSAN
jgi:hypothetical protein